VPHFKVTLENGDNYFRVPIHLPSVPNDEKLQVFCEGKIMIPICSEVERGAMGSVNYSVEQDGRLIAISPVEDITEFYVRYEVVNPEVSTESEFRKNTGYSLPGYSNEVMKTITSIVYDKKLNNEIKSCALFDHNLIIDSRLVCMAVAQNITMDWREGISVRDCALTIMGLIECD
jgi:hypothetical protein